MRLISVLLVLAVIGWLVAERWQTPGEQRPQQGSAGGPPEVPDRPGEVPKFEQDMDRFMKQQGDRRQQQLRDQGG